MKMLKSGKRSGLPHVNMIEIKGHFGTELTRNKTSVMHNENREKEMTISFLTVLVLPWLMDSV